MNHATAHTNTAHLFIIDVVYTADLATIERHLASHRAYLAQGYKQGFLLASGPKSPREGGIIIGRFASMADAKDFAAHDPYALQNIAKHTIIEFHPVLHAEHLKHFLSI